MTTRLIQLRHAIRPVMVQLLILVAWLILQDCPTLGQQMAPLPPSSSDPRQVSADMDETAHDDGLDDLDDILSLADESLESLSQRQVVAPALEAEVTTVSRQVSTMGRTPAAVFVITQEMIRRSGARCVPDVLRMVPGLHVARITANQWAVTSRGFNGTYANKLLVQIDGRSVYTPLFAGTYWESQDTPLEDIERIEVIRGPGATVWGANAVNGVINIITKDARDTLGALVSAGGGTEERDFATLRYGGKIGSDLNWRAYGKYFNRDRAFASGGAGDNWQVGQTGFRIDWDLDPCKIDKITFQGDYFEGNYGNTRTLPSMAPPYQETLHDNSPSRGGNLLTRWTHTSSERSDFALQFYHDWAQRPGTLLTRQNIGTYDVDFQQRFPLCDRQQLIWGLGYRSVAASMVSSTSFVFTDPEHHTNLYSAFIQDEITVVEDRLFFTAGCKGEHNDFTGYEFQPTARAVWLPSEQSSIWASFSRAVRTPSLVEIRGDFLRLLPPLGPAVFPTLLSNRDFRSEELLAYELGYRAQPTDTFSWDLALFYNVYDRLRSIDVVALPVMQVGNAMTGKTYGVELAGQWDLSPCWQLRANYTFLQMQLHVQPNPLLDPADAEGENPHNQVYLQSSHDLNYDLEFDIIARYVDSIPTMSISNYVSLDLRLAWHPDANVEAAVVARNLLANHRYEYKSSFFQTQNTGVERGVYGMVTWRY